MAQRTIYRLAHVHACDPHIDELRQPLAVQCFVVPSLVTSVSRKEGPKVACDQFLHRCVVVLSPMLGDGWAQSSPIQSNPTRSSPTLSNPIRSNLIQPKPVQLCPIRSSPIQFDPIQPHLIQWCHKPICQVQHYGVCASAFTIRPNTRFYHKPDTGRWFSFESVSVYAKPSLATRHAALLARLQPKHQ